MSSPYPPQAPKRLERSKSNRILGGVCAGVANYLNMDPTLVRVLTVVISLFTGVPVILYIIALFVVPEEGSQPAPPTYPPVGGPQAQATGFPTAPPQTAPPAYAPQSARPPRRLKPLAHRHRLRTRSGAAKARPGNSDSLLRSRQRRSLLARPSPRRLSSQPLTKRTLLSLLRSPRDLGSDQRGPLRADSKPTGADADTCKGCALSLSKVMCPEPAKVVP
jgi:phage shock protein PspC (stress-responsive transcriptional regulator)